MYNTISHENLCLLCCYSRSSTLNPLCTTLVSKLTLENHLRLVASSISQSAGLLRKSCKIFFWDTVVRSGFSSFRLLYFECCSAVWIFLCKTNFKLLDRAFNQQIFSTVVQLIHLCIIMQNYTFFWQIITTFNSKSLSTHPCY